ncbi:hypothetical protein B9G98_00885 [Wickerhamiella sorbophila]|uniref:Uncharacterized protein n=1 Tax=Wickerhamiella sorbophila TaxID=45607 RepID=A0A2T0FE67_9ASCO|nr:hypothetical protein B9G98_00885 [Wickerhamiella sorbophila]PRT53265.1 hypothetical protein B9G98_00885 [Wickerhamiella sorbophila]
MLINLGVRLANYIAAPFVERATNWAVQAIESIPPETRRRWITRLAYVLRPLFVCVDYFRLALVRGYVHNAKCARVLSANTHELNSLVYSGKSPATSNKPLWTRHDATEKTTTAALFPVMLLVTPLFFLSDFARSKFADYLHPNTHSRVETLLDSIWAVQYGSVISS